MKIMKQLLVIIIFLSACKKNGGEDTPQDKPYRVKQIQNSGEQRSFTYDAENRITRIDFNGGSFRFTYSGAEILAQTHFANNEVDLSWRYKFVVAGGRITGGARLMSNGAVGRTFLFEYDNQQRLSTAIMSLKNFTGDEDENSRYQFSYDAQNNLQQVIMVRKIKSGSTLVNSDSTSATLTYFNNKSFITYKQLGFDFFGSATAAIQLQGMETIPFSFTFIENIVPSAKAVQLIDTKKYKWGDVNSTWSPASSSAPSFSETDYLHNDGQLNQFKNNTIQWEPY